MNENRHYHEKGSTTIYFAIISAAFIGVFALVMSSLLRMQQTNEMMRQASLASDLILSYYDSALESQYGLLAYQKNQEILKSAFEPYFGSDYQLEVMETLSSLEVFQRQAVVLGQLALANQALEQLEAQRGKHQQQIDNASSLQNEVSEREKETGVQLANLDERENLAEQTIHIDDSEALKGQKKAAKEMTQEEVQKAKDLFKRLKNRPTVTSGQDVESGEAQDDIDASLYSSRYPFDERTAIALIPAERLSFGAYLLANFNHRLRSSDNVEKSMKAEKTEITHVLEKGEIEYLLSGSSKTRVNYFNVYMRIFTIREGINLMHLSRSPEKMKLVTEASLLVSALFPIAQPLSQAGFLGLWATAESAEDLKGLLRGDSISLLKLRESEWQTDFDGALNLNAAKAPEEITGLSQLEWIDYKGYLALLISLEKSETLAKRAMTLIDLNLQRTRHRPVPWGEMVVSHRISVSCANGKEVEFEASYLSTLEK